jgi:catechol 2,3-dioxygenase-like lactoylglutathione lyase family enzyme
MRAREPFPILYVRDVERSETFYRDAFGFEARYRFPDSGPARFVYLFLEPSGIGIAAADGQNVHGNPVVPGAGSFELCLYVDDMTATCQRLRQLGARELREPVDEVWGECRAYYADPDGTTLHIAMKLAP